MTINDVAHFLLNAAGPVTVRNHPAPEAPGNSIGLEAIIRKALMGKYDDASEERSPSSAANADGRAEDLFSQGTASRNLFFSDDSFAVCCTHCNDKFCSCP